MDIEYLTKITVRRTISAAIHSRSTNCLEEEKRFGMLNQMKLKARIRKGNHLSKASLGFISCTFSRFANVYSPFVDY